MRCAGEGWLRAYYGRQNRCKRRAPAGIADKYGNCFGNDGGERQPAGPVRNEIILFLLAERKGILDGFMNGNYLTFLRGCCKW
jgi:hypothetical protein